MSKFIPGNQKHLTLEDRVFIENSLNQRRSFKDIAKYLCKDPTTISKEVKLRRASDWYHKGSFYNAKNFCVRRYNCRKVNVCNKILVCGIKCTSCPTCNQTCPDFQKEHCSRLDKAPMSAMVVTRRFLTARLLTSIPTMRTLLIVGTTRFSRTPEAA